MASVTDNDHGVSATVNAVGAWGTSIVRGQSGTVSYTLGDGRSDVISPTRGTSAKARIAATTTGYYDTGTTGTCGGTTMVAITDSDTAFNLAFDYTTTGEPDGCSSEIYLNSVTTHEIGHLIGLGHCRIHRPSCTPRSPTATTSSSTTTTAPRQRPVRLHAADGRRRGACNNNGTCEAGRTATPARPIARRTGGKPANRYCAATACRESSETTALCDGNSRRPRQTGIPDR
jgi:hypothetical protein